MKRCLCLVLLLWCLTVFLADSVLIDDGWWVKLTVLDNRSRRYPVQTDFVLEIRSIQGSPLEVSYLMIDNTGTPNRPSSAFIMKGLNFNPPWNGTCFFKTEVSGWGQPEFKENPKYLPLPHYRTCMLLLARYEKIYLVFVRENDGQISYAVFKGGAFQNFEIPNVARMEKVGNEFVITSLGQPVEVGMWIEGRYNHDEVGGWAAPAYAAKSKRYAIPHYEMFMMMIGRYDKLALIVGKENDGRLGVVQFVGSQNWASPIQIPGFCTCVVSGTNLTVTALSRPVEITHFAFDNTSWQWEVGGWGQPGFAPREQTFQLKHYTPGLIVVNRYETIGVVGYNENDFQTGVILLKW